MNQRHRPGYIQGCVSGVRENGGQYTHAAVWAAMAFATLGDAARAWEFFTMFDPVRCADSSQAVSTYKTEPCVIASDVYAQAPHASRSGWTWYTGSARWTLSFILESLLGLTVEPDRLRIAPCVPKDWVSYQLNYLYRETLYRLKVLPTSREGDGPALRLDGTELFGSAIPLLDDHCEHAVVVCLNQTGDSRCRSA